MKEILIGFALCLVFFLCLTVSFYIGYKYGQRKKVKAEPLTLEEKLEQERRQKWFNNVMNYDVNKALGVKHE